MEKNFKKYGKIYRETGDDLVAESADDENEGD